MPKYNLFYNLLIYSINAEFGSVWGNVKKMGNMWKGVGNYSPLLFLLDIV